MTETCRSEVYLVLFRHGEDLAECGWWEEGHDEVLQQGVSPLEVDVRSGGEMGCLLEKDGVGSVDFTDVDRHFELLGGEDGVHDGDVGRGEVGGDGEDEDAGVDVGGWVFWGVGSGDVCDSIDVA